MFYLNKAGRINEYKRLIDKGYQFGYAFLRDMDNNCLLLVFIIGYYR